MLEKVPEEEIIEYSQRDYNPDFDVQKKAKTISTIPTEPVNHIPDMSSVFNSALAAKDDAIESLKRELRTKDGRRPETLWEKIWKGRGSDPANKDPP